MPSLLLHFSLNRKVFKLGKANPWQVNVLFVSGCDKYHDQKTWCRKSFLLQVIVSPSKEAKAKTQGRSWRLKPQRNTTYWLAPRLSLHCLSYTSQAIACTRDTLLVQGMALPIVGRLSSTDMPLGNQMEAITQLRLLLPRSVKLATKINHHS